MAPPTGCHLTRGGLGGLCWYLKYGDPLLLDQDGTLMAICSHGRTSGLTPLGAYTHLVVSQAFGPVSPQVPAVELLINYSLGPNPQGVVSDPHVCHPDLRPGEVRCSRVSRPFRRESGFPKSLPESQLGEVQSYHVYMCSQPLLFAQAGGGGGAGGPRGPRRMALATYVA
jgi:hypothetical protein